MKIRYAFLLLFSLIFVNPAVAQEINPDSIGTSYTYTNQEQDKSGLMHYDSRYYDPELGRFLQPDPFDVPNKYAYVSNNPVNRIDPSGHTDYPLYEDSWAFSGIDPTNTDTYSKMFSDRLRIDNKFIVGDMIGPWRNSNRNLYLDAAGDIEKELEYYQGNDARFVMSYEDYKDKNYPLFVDSSVGVNPVGMIKAASLLGKTGLLGLVEREVLTSNQAIELFERSSSKYTGKLYPGDSCISSARHLLLDQRKGIGDIIYSQNHAFVVSIENGMVKVFDTKPHLSFIPMTTNEKLRFFRDLIAGDAKSLTGAAIDDYFMLKLNKQQWIYGNNNLKTFDYLFMDQPSSH